MLKIISLIKNLIFIIKSDANIKLISIFIKFSILKKFYFLNLNQKNDNKKFKKKVSAKNFSFSSFWFYRNINFFKFFLDKIYSNKKVKLSILEIGSYEGLSAVFFLNTFKNSQVTCVDIFKNSIEYKKKNKKRKDILNNLGKIFDYNMLKYKNKIKKYNLNSYDFYKINKKNYDLIYVDGSHFSCDVIIDLIKSFEILKKNGYLIIDDYLWKYYQNLKCNPCYAINTFLKLNFKNIKILYLNEFVILKKIKNLNMSLSNI